LPGTLTLESLRHDHASVPNNPLIAESLYLTRYIERVGSGTQAMIELCRESGLPEPAFEQRQGFFVLTLWRDWLTTTVIAQLVLNARQRQAVLIAKTSERLSNLDYQKAFGVSKPTASRDLEDMLRKGILEKIGTTGKGTYYVLNRKGLTKGSKGS
jgi:ATP-dependent DNA helicase RecG